MASAITKRVGEQVGRLRRERGMSQEALAAKARVNRVTIARLELGAHPPNLDTLDRIARALGTTLADLVQ
jgi:transcriptional regulator with XRE-family HTH domain